MRSRDDLRLLLAAVRRRWRGQVSLRAAGRAAAIAAAPLFAAAVVARLLPLGDGALIASRPVRRAGRAGRRGRHRPRDPAHIQAIVRSPGSSKSASRATPSSSRLTMCWSARWRRATVESRAFDAVIRRGGDGAGSSRSIASKVVPPRAMRRASLEAVGGVAVLAVAVAVAWPCLRARGGVRVDRALPEFDSGRGAAGRRPRGRGTAADDFGPRCAPAAAADAVHADADGRGRRRGAHRRR